MEYLTEKRFADFEDRLWERFDKQDDLTRKMGERVAVVEAQSNKNEHRLDNLGANTKKTAAGWGAGVGTAAAGFVYGLLSLFWTRNGGQ